MVASAAPDDAATGVAGGTGPVAPLTDEVAQCHPEPEPEPEP